MMPETHPALPLAGVAPLPGPGDVIGGKYRVDALSARGGMAAIFLGQHLVLGQRVAIKVMLAESAREEASVERFMREAQAAARVETEHVTRVMDAGLLDDGLPFLVMEFLEGCDLGALLAERGPLPCDVVVDYALETLEGLAHVHSAGIVHRDLKPSNLFLARRPDGSTVVKLLDFGISKSLVAPEDARVKALTGNVVVGSPVYMSPEQVRSARSVDARSDLWSLGVSIYELVTGALPFDGDGVGEVLAEILGGTPRPMQTRRADVPAGLDAVVGRCLARDREERHADVLELARALAPFARSQVAAAAAVDRIESTLIHAPQTRAPTSLGSLHVVRATHVERVSALAAVPGPAQDGSGAFALSRTHADVSRVSTSPRRRRAAHMAKVGVAAAVLASVVGLAFAAVATLPHGLLRSRPAAQAGFGAGGAAAAAAAGGAWETGVGSPGTGAPTAASAAEAAAPADAAVRGGSTVGAASSTATTVTSAGASAGDRPAPRPRPAARPASSARPSFLKSRK